MLRKKTIQMSWLDFIGLMIAIVVLVFFRSFVVMKGWNWFIAETFAIRTISLWQSMGIAAFVWALLQRSSLAEKPYGLDGEHSISALVMNQLVNTLWSLAVLCILHKMC